MNYITTSYRQTAINHSTLLLQQFRFKNSPLCLLILCDGQSEDQGRAGAYLSKRLLQWFRGQRLRRLAREPDRYIGDLEVHLQTLLLQCQNDLITCGLLKQGQLLTFSGILCSDDRFLLFNQGNQQIYLLNQSFGQSHIQDIANDLSVTQEVPDSLVLRQGILQRDVGILFSTEAFCQKLAEKDIRECLYVEEIRTELQAQRRLQELGRRAESLGGQNMTATLLLSRP